MRGPSDGRKAGEKEDSYSQYLISFSFFLPSFFFFSEIKKLFDELQKLENMDRAAVIELRKKYGS